VLFRSLVLCCVAPEGSPQQTFLIGRSDEWQRGSRKFVEVNKTYRFDPVEHPEVLLAELTRQMRAGLRAPLLFPPDTSMRYATKVHYGGEDEAALDASQKEWGKRMGERTWDAHLARVLGDLMPPFEEVVTEGLDFGELATTVFVPLLQARKDGP
jgi:exonuclease V gamma subunit